MHNRTVNNDACFYPNCFKTLPDDWNCDMLSNLGAFFKGAGISKAELSENGLPCVRYGEIYTRHHFIVRECASFIPEVIKDTATPIRGGDILFACSGETKEEIGKCVAFLGDYRAYAGGDIIIFRPDGKVNPFFASYFLNTVGRKQINRLGQGDSIVHIHRNNLEGLKIPIPPLPEQKKIAEILGAWDEGIGKLEKFIAGKDRRKKALMQKLLTGKQRLKGFKGEWKQVRLGEVCQIKRGGSPRPIEAYITTDTDGLCWLRIGDIDSSDKYIYHTSEKIRKEGLVKTTMVHDGDLILSNSMSFGRPYIMKISACIHDGWLAFQNVSREVDKDLLYYLFSSDKLQGEFLSLAAGSGVRNLKKEVVQDVVVKLPPLPEQQAIAEVLSTADEEIRLLSKKLDLMKLQKKGLMQKLLSGAWRVGG